MDETIQLDNADEGATVHTRDGQKAQPDSRVDAEHVNAATDSAPAPAGEPAERNGTPESEPIEDFDLEDIEIIESKVFA